ncbi:DUF6261 family protein [Streptococcus marmotae]|uniref:DUF6261 family protein n=1 Tax=Streptococcus marmotae TaxID=1825069 RepID=UPI00082B1E8E|nr:DUF6261 family protein [Streptococcus marmotae]
MAQTYGVKSLTTTTLDNATFFQLMTESKDTISAFAKAHAKESVYHQQLEQLTKLLESYQVALTPKSASKTVKSLELADQERDDALTTLTSLIRAFSRVKDQGAKAAYETLSTVLKQYKVETTTSYEKESAGISQLLKALSNSACQEALEQLHLTLYVEQLSSAQASFDSAYKARLTEQKEVLPSQTKKLRAQLAEIYTFLVDFTAIMAHAYPDRAELADLRDQLNVIRSRYKKRKVTKTSEVASHETAI